jgi:hypothetical protein
MRSIASFFKVSENAVQDVRVGLLLSLALVLPISTFLCTRVVLLLALFNIGTIHWRIMVTAILKSWTIFLYGIVLLVGLLYSEKQAQGLEILETQGLLFVLPIALAGFEVHNYTRTLDYFIVGLLSAGLWCLIIAISNVKADGYILPFFGNSFTGALNFDPTYFAYYLVFGITYSLFSFFFFRDRGYQFRYLVGAICFAFFLLLTGGASADISLLFILVFFILASFSEFDSIQRLPVFLVVGFFLLVLFGGSIFFSKWGIRAEDSWDRFLLWQDYFFAYNISIIGEGTGHAYFFESDSYNGIGPQVLNVHNQYLQSLYANGVFGLITFLLILTYPIFFSYRANDSFWVLVFFPFLIYAATENILGRAQGTIFLAFLLQIFHCKQNLSVKRDSIANVKR